MNDFEKVVCIGELAGFWRSKVFLFCRIKYKNGELTISGVEGPYANGNCAGGCGQVNMHEWEFLSYCAGWDAEKVAKFREVWKRWHLNGMRGGSPAQEQWLLDNPIPKEDYAYPKNHYDVASERLREAGLNPDPSFMHNGKNYSYGSAWLKKEVPVEVLEWLNSLPYTERSYAWV